MFETLVSSCWVFFQETQTGQPSDNFPWFFDLNPSFERNASRVDAFYFFHLTLELFVVCFWCWVFFHKLKQANQATISHGSSTCLHPFDVLHRLYSRCFYFFSFDRRCLLFVGCFFRFRRHAQLPKLSIRNKFVMKMLFCTIIVVIMSNHIRRITLNLLCTVTCCVVQQI